MSSEGTIGDLFWQRVTFGPTCWEWQGHIDVGGYGRSPWTSEGVRKSTPAHRIAWELCVGAPIPEGLWVLHKCDNPPCVRPDHLFLGTHLDNVRDMHAKDRGQVGERHHRALLKEDDIRAIRRKYPKRGVTARKLATEYGVSITNVYKIVTRKSWAHVM